MRRLPHRPSAFGKAAGLRGAARADAQRCGLCPVQARAVVGRRERRVPRMRGRSCCARVRVVPCAKGGSMRSMSTGQVVRRRRRNVHGLSWRTFLGVQAVYPGGARVLSPLPTGQARTRRPRRHVRCVQARNLRPPPGAVFLPRVRTWEIQQRQGEQQLHLVRSWSLRRLGRQCSVPGVPARIFLAVRA